MAEHSQPQDFWLAARQGDVLTVLVDELLALALELERGATADVVVLSQTCDLVQPGREFVTVARIGKPPESSAVHAERGAIPRWARIPSGGQDFADLHQVVSVRKSNLEILDRRSGIAENDWEGERKFAQAAGRNFSRYAFPDEVVPWLEPVRRQLADKAPRKASAIGRVLEDVLEVRLAADDWNHLPLVLTIYLVVRVGRLGEPNGPLTPGLLEWLEGTRSANEIAERLRPGDGHRPSGADEVALFDSFAEALGRACLRVGPSHPDESVKIAVSDVRTDVRSEDDFGLDLFRRSERLDIDYLSPPTVSS